MADNLVFGVKIDLQKGVEEALKDGDKALERIEKIFGKHPITIKLRMDNRVARGTSAELTGFKKQLAELTQQWNSLTAAERGSAAGAAIREKFRALRTEAQGYTSTLQAAVKAEDKMRESHSKTAASANKLSSAYHNQSTYLSRLIQRMAVYAGVSYVGNFLTNVREVTAQFELQRVSLGAIIQDTNKASQLFSEIKTFALKSPVSIMDLTKYTKQVAAYGIETKKLFDTTKMLTDISVGLGTDMSRAVLFFGQVYASNYLRASELRQATELGIPLVDKLAKKLEELNGRGYTAAEVMDLISKRAISFDLVEQVFKDMTSAGGQFYNIQEKQGNTLFGLWAKLGDAASVMYDEIGNTESVNSGMKTAIGLLTELMRNWKAVAKTAQWVIVPNAALLALYKYSTATQRVDAAQSAAAAATERRKAAVLQLSAAIEKGSVDDINAANAALQKAKADDVAAQKATTRMGLLKSGFVSVAKSIGAGLGIGLIIGAVTTLAYKLFEAYENAHRLDRKLDEIDAERITLASQSVRNFEYLADVAVKAADGSKKQKDALDELRRTYKEMIPVQDLTIEHLRQLREGTNNASEAYKSLTTAIREYISEQQKQKKLSAIEEEYGSTITDKYKKLYSELTKGIRINVGGSKIKSWVELQFSPEEFERAMVEFEKRATDKTKSVGQKIKESFAAIGFDLTPDQIKALQKVGKWGEFDDGYFITLNEALEEQSERINAVHTGYAGFVGDLGKYGAEMSRIADVMENKIYKANGKVLESNSFLRKQMQSNEWIKEWTNSLKTNLPSAGIEIKNEWFNFIKSLNSSDPNTISSINFDAILEVLNTDAIREKLGEHYEQTKNYVLAIQKEYQDLVPQNRTVAVLRAKLSSISQATGVSMDKLQHYWMNADESIEDYAKRIKGTIEDLQKTILEMQQINADKEAMKPGSLLLKGYSEEEIKQANALLLALQQLFAGLKGFTKGSGGSGRQSDPRLQNLKEEISLTKKLYDEYHKLEKQVGATRAAEKIQEIYSNTIKTLQGRAGKYGFKFELPFTDENLKANMQHFIDKMKELQKLRDKKGKPLFPNIGKEIDEAVAQLEDVDLNSLQKALEKKLKELSDRISRTKTAKEFYEKILGMTGDYSLASKVADSIFGQNGSTLQKALADQVRGMTNKIELPEGIISADNIIDYKALRQFAEANKNELGKMYDELIKISDNGEKELTNNFEGYLKDLEVAKTYADKRIELARTTAAKIREIEQQREIAKRNGKDTKVYDDLIRGYQEREDREAAKLEYDAFKDTPLYVQMFEDLEHASTSTLEMMKSRLEGLSGVWGTALDPTQLKEIQSRMNEIDAQLRTRNPFKTLKESYQQYRDAVKSVSLQGAVENAGTAGKDLYDKSEVYGADSAQARAAEKELKAREKIVEIARQITAENKKGATALDAAAQIANDNLKIKRGELEIAAAEEQALRDKSTYEDPDQDPKVIAAHEAVEAAKEGVNLAERVAEITTNNAKTAKTLKENFASAANQVTQYMGMAGDLAHAVADTMEALGGDEDDVQFWNDIGDAIGDLTAGFQGIIDSILSLNVAGVISNAIGVIPNMVKGFVGLFSAGKVRKANKEIKRQQELLEQLEYSYGRLEKMADKLFGRDYLNNYTQRMKNLQAQAAAYQKQYEAEKSKGKKADEEKLKEFQEQYRDTMNEIADMQDELVAHFTGSGKTDVARQMAKAWIDARASMSDTFAAIKGDYADMIKNMIVEGAAARVIENALTPVWSSMEAMLEKNDVEGAIDSLVNGMDSALNAANNGMEVLWKALEARGYDLKKLLGEGDSEYSGIAKSVAGATSEEILQLSGFINTALYYVAPIPRIDENLARVVALMEGRTAALPTASGITSGAIDYTEMFTTANQHLSSLPRMEQHLSEIHTMLGRALKTKGSTTGFNTFLNS